MVVTARASAQARRAAPLRRGGALLILLLAIPLSAAACDLGRDPGAGPTPSPTGGSAVPPSVGATSTPGIGSLPPSTTGPDPIQPPDGAELLDRWEEVEEGVHWQGVAYRVPAAVGDVRAQYRERLRAEGWTLIDTEFDEDGWELEWAQGDRELEIELRADGEATIVEQTLSEPVR